VSQHWKNASSIPDFKMSDTVTYLTGRHPWSHTNRVGEPVEGRAFGALVLAFRPNTVGEIVTLVDRFLHLRAYGKGERGVQEHMKWWFGDDEEHHIAINGKVFTSDVFEAQAWVQ
jgi:hypothetical protein